MLSHLALFAVYALYAAAAAAAASSDVAQPIYSFGDDLFLENIAVCANGHLLFTSITEPRLYTLNPTSPHPTPHLLTEFNKTVATGFSGITEYMPDQFVFIAAQFDAAHFTARNTSLWSIDMRSHGIKPVKAVKIVDLPGVGFGNGLVTLPDVPDTVLISDSVLGALWSVNVHSGVVSMVVQNDAFSITSSSSPVALGINGIRIHDHDLFFVNTNTAIVAKVPIHVDGSLAGNITVLASPLAGQITFDDLAIDKEGRPWIATIFDAVDMVLPNGTVVAAVAGLNPNPQPSSGPSSAAFGRGSRKQERTLYVTTGFGILYAVDTSKLVLL
ncbi:hypothetical protein BKA62DRAFT_701367 [Auriculariales sp. MPI-PUGE-AT-0066]|nr:hypothetical protein BKA62DRAFT_701367 [Auriculariales sp. MPI-PUGE-AT-0066]